MRSFGSVWRGVKAMSDKSRLGAGWAVRWYGGHQVLWWAFGWRIRFWAHWWTPVWHEGRGPYVSIGLGVVAIYRGY